MPRSAAEFEGALAAGLGQWPERGGVVFLAALSGGADSTALVAGLAALRDGGAAFSFRCLHVNHNIRSPEECAGDEKAVIALCRRLAVPLRVCRAAPGAIAARSRHQGLEAAARHFRHAALRREARRIQAQAILTAHTQNDLLETILMAVLRGAGPAGLGVWRRIDAVTGRVPILRPLVELGREDIATYLAARGLSWREDPSNADTRFLRNRIRRLLIPLLDAEFPGWRRPLLRLNENQADIADFLAAQARDCLRWEAEDGAFSVPQADFFAQNPVIREEALFAALDALGAVRPRRAALASFVRGEQNARDLGGFRLEKRGGRVTVKAGAAPAGERGFSVLIKEAGFYKLEERALALTVGGKDAAEDGAFGVSLPFVLRALSGGRFLEARDRAGRAALFNDRGEVVRTRPDAGRAEGEIRARLFAGYALSAHYKE